jgi:hypothetical protein
MKLLEIIEPLFESGILIDNTLIRDNLKLIKNLILKCDEFKDVTELVISGQPCARTATFKLNENFSFKGVVKIVSFHRSPPLFDKDILNNSKLIKDNASISPCFHKPDSIFSVNRRIIMDIDLNSLRDKGVNQYLNILNDILINSKDYEHPPFYNYMIRGVFEDFKNEK